MLVTPVISATSGTNSLPLGRFDTFPDTPSANTLFPPPGYHPDWHPADPVKTQTVGFIDWLSIHQTHERPLPVFSNGAVVRFDANGTRLNVRIMRHRIEGPYETGLFLRCDGHTVWFEGNVSRCGRPDNVFGYSFRECLGRVIKQAKRGWLPDKCSPGRHRWSCRNGWQWRGTALGLAKNFSIRRRALYKCQS